MPGLIAITYVDNFGIAFKTKDLLEHFLEQLESHSLQCTREASFHEFLGIKISKQDDGSLLLTQQGLIEKILQMAKMENCNRVFTPAQAMTLGDHKDL